jgi:hypothetical protein
LGRRRTVFGDEWWPEEANQRRRERLCRIASGTREKREEGKREERGGRKVTRWFKLRPVTSIGLARLGRAACSGVIGGHTAQGGWTASHATADSVTQLHHSRRRDSVVPVRLARDKPTWHHINSPGTRLPHGLRQCIWHDSFISHVNCDSKETDLNFFLAKFIS